MSIISIHVFFLESLFIYVVKRVHKVSSYENEALTACYCLFISVIPLEIQLSSRNDMDSITRFNPLFAQVSRQDRIQRNMSIFRGTRLYHCLCCCYQNEVQSLTYKLN
jgi:hypothetical protein